MYTYGVYQKGVESTSKKVIYRVRELERNTVYVVSDKDGYAPYDTVWFSPDTKSIDPTDNNGMIAVIDSTYSHK